MRLFFVQSLKMGTRSFIRNTSLVLLTILAIVGIQLILMAGLFGKTIFNYSLAAVERRVDVRLSLITGAPTASVQTLQQKLGAMPAVKSVDLITSDTILNSFKDKHTSDFLTLQALKELPGNPFGDELVVKLKSSNDYQVFFSDLHNSAVITQDLASIIEDTDTSHSDELVQRLTRFQSIANTGGIALTVVASLVVALILIVVSRLFLSQYTNDIAVMRTYGVAESHIGAWLCVTYVLCIIVATALSVLGVSFLFGVFDAYVAKIASGLSLSNWFSANMIGIVGFIFFVSMAIIHFVTWVFLSTTNFSQGVKRVKRT